MLRKLWHTSWPLTVTGLLMLPLLGWALIGLAIDPRLVTGAPVWLKPAKFAASVAIFTFTLAWIFTLLPDWKRMRYIVERTALVVFVLELAIINVQAWRGTASHFNAATQLDAALFNIMGIAIFVQSASMVAVAVAVWRQRFRDPALGWALRLGVTMTIAGAVSGGFMLGPTRQQLADAEAAHRMPIAGAHTVGASDGGPGLIGTGWSTAHGDLRVPHFVGLHAMQLLPLFGVMLARRRINVSVRSRLVVTAAVSYLALYLILLVQALNGESVAAPSAATIGQLAGWMVASLAAAGLTMYRALPVRTVTA